MDERPGAGLYDGAFFQTLVEQASQGWIVLQDQRIVYANPSVERLSGYTIAELQAMRADVLDCLLHPDDRARLHSQARSATSGTADTERQEYRLLRKDGQVRWIEVAADRMYIREQPALRLSIYDISALKSREQHSAALLPARRAADARRNKYAGNVTNGARRQPDIDLPVLQQAIEQSPSGVIITDAATRICYVNAQITALTGYTADELIGQTPQIFASAETPPETYQDLREHMRTRCAWHGVFRNRKKSGDLYWERASIAPIVNAQGHITHYIAIKNDLSGPRRMFDELHKSRAYLKAIFDNAAVALVVLDRHGTCMDINPHGAAMFGFQADDFIGKRMASITLPEDLPAIRDMYQALLKREIPYGRLEKIYLRKDGSRFWGDLSWTPIFAEDGSIESVLGIIVDINERKEAEAALQDSETRHRLIASLISDYAYGFREIGDGRLVIEWMSDSFAQLTNFPLNTPITSDDWLAIIHPDDRSLIYQRRAPLRMGQTVTNELANYYQSILDNQFPPVYEYQQNDLAVLALATPLFDEQGQITAGMVVIVNISERKRLERELQSLNAELEQRVQERTAALLSSETRYRTLVDTLPDAVLLTDLDGRIQFCNQQALLLFGYTLPADLLGRRIDDLFVAGNEAAGANRFIATDEQSRNVEHLLRRRDGSIFPAIVSNAAVRDEQGNVTALIMVLRDISQQKRLQAQIIASERMAIGGRLAASVAHEINTPLQAIQNLLALIEDAADAERTEYVTLASQEVQRVGRIIGYFLDLYRARQTRSGPVAICTVMDRVLLLLGKRMKDQKVALQRPAQLAQVYVRGYKDALTQVFLNLIINALDAMPRGGTLTIACRLVDNSISIDVQDTGGGIDPALQERIFEPFLTSKPQGTGMGLTISKDLIVQLEGTITVSSRPGLGSTFTVRLPVVVDHVDPSNQSADPQEQHHRKETVQ